MKVDTPRGKTDVVLWGCSPLWRQMMCDLHEHDDLNDDLPWEFADRVYDAAKAERLADLPVDPRQQKMFIENCPKCGGSGRAYGGVCFKCNGKGKMTFKTSREDRQRAAATKAARAIARIEEWHAEHPAESLWITNNAPKFGFAASMAEALTRYGHLTENQLSAVRRCAARDVERQERFAAERAEREASAVAVAIERIEEALLRARGNQVRWPKLRLDTFVFSLAGEQSRNPGAVYVKDKETDAYLGKIMGGKFTRSRDCNADHENRIVAAASDPEAAAKAYGRRYGACSICGRELTVDESINRAMGPICAGKYGWA